MTTLVDRISLQWERVYPLGACALGLVIGYLYAPGWLHNLHAREWAIENIFVAVFTLATVTAGFGLAIYTFLLTTESGFIGRAKKSIYYRQMLTYVVIAAGLSTVVALISVPGMIIKQAPEPHSLHAVYIALWLAASCWTAAAVYRAGYLFSIFARQHH
jgi:hypothetical protein